MCRAFSSWLFCLNETASYFWRSLNISREPLLAQTCMGRLPRWPSRSSLLILKSLKSISTMLKWLFSMEMCRMVWRAASSFFRIWSNTIRSGLVSVWISFSRIFFRMLNFSVLLRQRVCRAERPESDSMMLESFCGSILSMNRPKMSSLPFLHEMWKGSRFLSSSIFWNL